ncbi:MBL fold metallo-hydrolase [Enterovirga sp.]|uniref:MBL fold metallo-hydrolase n=1 Tax=Enterovirga sp. TaxID=2026350 RepID=UPI0026363C17|nr:MBL fold metallo-hydrolase [Enterovirga sp.]MDB5590586.1 fold metallo-hydrolase [Enterovirga sp.]
MVLAPGLAHPHPVPPAWGEAIEVAPGILWTRLPLPFRLDHVNCYLIEDGPGWAVVDTGIGNEHTREVWEALLAGPLRGRPLTRLIVTHMHPDHVGAAGWLASKLGLPLDMTETEYLQALVLTTNPSSLEKDPYRSFYVANGLDQTVTEAVMTRGHDYLRMLTGLPHTFRRVIAGDRLIIGGRSFDVFTGGGHASEQMMLYLASENVFLSADQVLPRISPNVSVSARDPQGDPLGIFLRSLRSLRSALPEDAFVLPGHDLPFTGLHARLDAMAEHHEERCAEIVAACREAPRSGAELVPVIFPRPLDAHQTGFAFSEVLAHVNYLIRRGRLVSVQEADGIHRAAAV